ncbi:MAG: hypothetical protein A3F72_16010 [Bacteroidetes bacterium RIFCSPLOWO2_12_FULL_35_15]|nr:MAG: hypothetical protein A3F72_16010 [Bacteroidetes bacterium RIFCSPLOWO2_12_FULL_35_15]
MKNKYVLIPAILLLIAIGVYLFFYAPTKIALVNFTDSQMAEIAKANDNSFIKTEQVNVKEDDFLSIIDYPVIYLFHISMLSEEQRANLKIAMDNGAKVHVFAATSKENNFSNITGDDLQYISDCFENDGETNIKSWLNYSRKIFDGKNLFADEIKEPVKFPKDVFYRIGTEHFFTKTSEYWNYYKKEGLFKEEKPVIVIINSQESPQTQYRTYQDSIILNLERRNFNVVAVAGFEKRLENLQTLNPDLVIYFPHGRLTMNKGDEVIKWLQEKNILLLNPQIVEQSYEDWMKDQQGMSGGMFGQSIVTPELDGGIHPYAVAAQYKNEEGYHTYKPIPGRIEKFCETTERWLSLKKKPNSEKKLCVYYYKGAGKNGIVAGGLEVGSSLFSLLKKLKSEGYTTGALPETTEALLQKIQKEGPLLGDYAQGTLKEFVKEGNPALIPVNEYESWCKSELDPESYKEVIKQYGKAPGTYMTTTVNDSLYLAIPRVRFGNICLLPLLPAALGENEFKMTHGVKQAPPHAYIASYLWSRMAFKTDVVAHFGAHGSVEFTPWKQVTPSLQDWPEALIAPVPHLYIYSIDNIGEAMMAKRRTYATMISHLTPPQSESELYGDLKQLGDILHKYPDIQDAALKKTYQNKIRILSDSLNLYKDLSISKKDMEQLSEETINTLHNYVHHIEREKINMGLHTLGVKYSDDEIDETVRMMAINPLATNLKELEEQKGSLSKEYDQNHDHHHSHYKGDSHHHADDDYETIASDIIIQIIKKGADPLSFISEEDKKTLTQLELLYPKQEQGGYSSYSYPKNKEKHEVKLTEDSLKVLLITLEADSKTEGAIASLKEDEAFKELSGLLDEKNLKKFETAADFNSSMQKKVDLIKNKGFKKLLSFMQKPEQKGKVFALLESSKIKDGIQEKKIQIGEKLMQQANDRKYLDDILFAYKATKENFQAAIQSKSKAEVEAVKARISFYLDNTAVISESENQEKQDLLAVQAILKSKESTEALNGKIELLNKRLSKIVQEEKAMLQTLQEYKATLLSIIEYKQNLIASPELELSSFINGMNGGYITPSSGGDPISNPQSVPTGKNLFSINAELTPTKEAFETGKQLAEQVLQKHIAKHGDYPKKIAYSLWGGEFIRDQGMNIGQIFYMLGVEPVWNNRGRMHDVKLIPMEQLKRPRIDVVVQTSGQFRDIAASRVYLINKAIEVASNADDNGKYNNYVKEGTATAEKMMKEKGLSPADARKFSTVRVFGGVNGHYGTGIMGMVEKGDSWETDKEIADQYIKNMGAMYAEGNWSEYKEGMFEAMLQNTEVVMHPRSSNVTGPISLDHVYEFMGGLTASIRVKTGKDPDGYFNDYRNKYNPNVQGLKEAIWTETRTNLFNPKFIKAQLSEGATAAENFAENFRDTYGWNVMKPDAIDKEIWEGYYNIYVKDSLKLGTLDFFKEKNPYALQEMTAVMLETVRKGYWKPNDAVVKDIVNLHAGLVKDFKAGCSGFVCDNSKLKAMIEQNLTGALKETYNKEIANVRTGIAGGQKQEGMVLQKEEFNTEKVKEIIKENMSTVISLVITILLIIGAVVWGIIRRRRQS